jgi:hypothetical protein
MALGLAFWVLMMLWFVFGMVVNWPGTNLPYGNIVSSVLLFVLFVLLGWHAFGAPIHG